MLATTVQLQAQTVWHTYAGRVVSGLMSQIDWQLCSDGASAIVKYGVGAVHQFLYCTGCNKLQICKSLHT